jgi:hypothetical protein
VRNVPLATSCRLLQITKGGSQVVANVGDGDFQLAHPAMPVCQWRDICAYRLK